MQKHIALMSLAIILSGCGSKFKAKNLGLVDPDFQPHVDRFTELTELKVIHVDIYYNEQSGSVIGVCKRKGDEKNVEIDPEWWSDATYLDREILIFHELAHCLLGQGHRDYQLDDDCPGSIMDTYHVGSYCYEKHYDYYIEELLNGEPL